MINIQVARDFSRHPAGRFEKDGPYSGELFRRKHLAPYLKNGESVTVEMDGARGYGSSFLEEAFGGLIREGFTLAFVQEKVRILASNPSLEHEIQSYLISASNAVEADRVHRHTHH
ncbi:UNVERIFIED_ORG: hypothetical protein ABIC54_002171 [Burkholderia sp. 1263]